MKAGWGVLRECCSHHVAACRHDHWQDQRRNRELAWVTQPVGGRCHGHTTSSSSEMHMMAKRKCYSWSNLPHLLCLVRRLHRSSALRKGFDVIHVGVSSPSTRRPLRLSPSRNQISSGSPSQSFEY
mmetsp:Transcript_94/g.84  ORF Transcript_94/g.84 Transcript_94/m.84 type:complete len:126 (+) Transcript_94:806-1183(+)